MKNRAREVKSTGAHFTPPELARFLARLALRHAPRRRPLRVLDPACGDGNLLAALAAEERRLRVVAVERDAAAIETARDRLRAFPDVSFEGRAGDFLARDPGRFDLVIANPPYVRTQVLGARESRKLAARLGLSGRVDLYHAFVKAITASLTPGGALALLCSNRFLTTLSGRAMRETLLAEYRLRRVLDLGDTKLFGASVLPAIVIGERRAGGRAGACPFARAYEVRGAAPAKVPGPLPEVLDALADPGCERARDGARVFRVEHGTLSTAGVHGHAWTLAAPETDALLARIRERADRTFADVAHVRVGIKTTADRVFIRREWKEPRPEAALLRPLLTHRVAARWRMGAPDRRVLYPHAVANGRRTAVELERYPRARAYLEAHRDRLAAREYLRASGRRWYEIWVPQDPARWRRPKIVWPDISEEPRFALDETGAIVNGDCYWMTLKDGVPDGWLALLLGVANSSLATRFYDAVCGNRLYAGRRRFITQYVARFPLPSIEDPAARRLARAVKRRLRKPVADDAELDELAWRAFGFAGRPTSAAR